MSARNSVAMFASERGSGWPWGTENDSPTGSPGVGYWVLANDQHAHLGEGSGERAQDRVRGRQIAAAGGKLFPQKDA